MFQGYTQGAIDFLWGLKLNNERAWFQEHKQEFTDLVDRPTRELATQLTEDMTEAFPRLGLELKVSRIYRDARRLFGRGPYKDHLWFSLRKPGEQDGRIPCFWFEIAPDHYGYGMGCWEMLPTTMAKLRARIDRDPKPVEKLARAVARRGGFTWRARSTSAPRGTLARCSIPGTTGRGWASPVSTTARGCSLPRSWPARCWRGGSPWCPSISSCAPCPETRSRNICEHGGPFRQEGPSFCRILPGIMQNVKIQRVIFVE